MGYFRITLDRQDILVEHRYQDVTLKEYRGRRAERLQHEIARDVALSDINHAIYLGRQLSRAEAALKEGRSLCRNSNRVFIISLTSYRDWKADSAWFSPPGKEELGRFQEVILIPPCPPFAKGGLKP